MFINVLMMIEMKNLDTLKKQGNLFDNIVSNDVKIYLLRVWGYESMVAEEYYVERKDRMNIEEERQLLEVLNIIRNKVVELGWNDNKIVCETTIGWHKVFIGYWDDFIHIGNALIPNSYLPKYKLSLFQTIKPIRVR